MQPQYSQGTAPSHHPPPYAPPEVSGNGGSVTSSLRQWRKKDYLEKKSTEENSPPVNESPSHIARVAPHTYYPRPPDDQCNFQHQYGDYSLSYKPPAPVKYSEIVENQQTTQTIENITPVIQKHKEKEYVELCSVAPQSHLKQFQDHIPMKQSTYMEPPFSHQYIPKDSQIHSFLQKQPQMPQYIQKEPYQQFLSKFNMQNQYPPPYSSEPNNFLAHLNKINPRMAQSIINDTHLRESQVPVYHNLEHNRPYPQPQRMYHPSSMPPNPAHPPRNLPPSYNYSQSYNYNVKPNIPPVDPYSRPYQHNMSKYLPEQPLPDIPPQHLYNESMHMNYGPYPPKISPNYSHLEYAQHYQHRRQFPQDYYTHPSYKDSFAQNPQLSPEDLGSESGPRKPSLKQYLETWVEENISGNLPEIVTSNALADMENLQHLKTALQAKAGETQDQPLYVLDTTEITNDNLPQFLHLQQFEKLPENIRGYYHSTNAASLEARQVIIENKNAESFPNVKLDSCPVLTKPLGENCSMVATVETGRAIEREEKSLENKVVEIHILEDSEAAEMSDGSPSLMLNARGESPRVVPDSRDDSVIKMCTRLQEDDSNHSEDSFKSMPDIECNGHTVKDLEQSVDEPVDLVMSSNKIPDMENVAPVSRSLTPTEDGTTTDSAGDEVSSAAVAEVTEPPDINRDIEEYENPSAEVSSLDKFLEEIGFEESTSPEDRTESSEPEILNNTQAEITEKPLEEDSFSDNDEEELKDVEGSRSIPENEDIPPDAIPPVEVTRNVSEQSMPESEGIPPDAVPRVAVTRNVSEPSMPENKDIPPNPAVTRNALEQPVPENKDIPPVVPRGAVTRNVLEQSKPENKDAPPAIPRGVVTRNVLEQSMSENRDVPSDSLAATRNVSEQSVPENRDIPPNPVPRVQVKRNVLEQPVPENKDIPPPVRRDAVTRNVLQQSMPEDRDVPPDPVPRVAVIPNVSEQFVPKNKDIPPDPVHRVEVKRNVSEQSVPQSKDILPDPVPRVDVKRNVSEQPVPQNKDIPPDPVPRIAVTRNVSEQFVPKNKDIPPDPVPWIEVERNVSKESVPQNKDIPPDPVPRVEGKRNVSEQSVPQNKDIPPDPVPRVEVKRNVSEQFAPKNKDIPPDPVPWVEVERNVSKQSVPLNKDIPPDPVEVKQFVPKNKDISPDPVPRVEVKRYVSEQSVPESKDVPPDAVPQVEVVTLNVAKQSMLENKNIPPDPVPWVEVTHNVSDQSMLKQKDIPRDAIPRVVSVPSTPKNEDIPQGAVPHVEETATRKNLVNMKNGRKRDRKKDLYKKEKVKKRKRVEYEHCVDKSEHKLRNEESCGEQILKEVECMDEFCNLPPVTVPENVPEATEENSEEMPVLEKATFDENDTNIVYHINDSNVILQIADELLEINITMQNGKKLILVKTFSDAVIMNNNEENCPILEDQTVVQPKSATPVEHPVMDNYANVTVDNVEMYVKEICEGPDIPIENEVCVFNEEVVSSSTEVESVPSNVPEEAPPPERATEEKKVAKKKNVKKKTVTWLDQTVPENVPKRCLDTKTPLPKIPKTKAALKLIEPHNSKIKDHCVPSKTKNTIADKIAKLKKPKIDNNNKLKHQKVHRPKKSESHPKNLPKIKERVIKHTSTPRKSDTFRHSRKSKMFSNNKTPVNIDSLYKMSIEPENLAKIKKGLEVTKPKSEKVKGVKLPAPEEPRLPLISVQENSITSSTCQDTEATQRERANKLIQQINDDWEDEDDNNKTVENNIRRLSLQEYNNRKRTSSITESDDKKFNLENPDLTSNLLGNVTNLRRKTPPKSPELSVRFINKTYSRTSSLDRGNESSPSRKGEESLSSSIELQLPKRSRILPTPNYNQEYLKKALINDLHTVNQITTTLIRENQELMHRFLEQQRLTAAELKKVKQIIRYKRLVQHLTTMKVKETEPNNNDVAESPINPSHAERNASEKRRKKRFRFLYSDDEFEEDSRNCSPIVVNETCLKRSCVDSSVLDYSVHRGNSQGQLTLVFKRNVKSDPRMQPFVKLERLPSLDRLALQL